MLIRNMKKSDYAEVDRLLLQIHQMDVSNRPDMFSPADQYMAQECYENLVDSPTVISILAQNIGISSDVALSPCLAKRDQTKARLHTLIFLLSMNHIEERESGKHFFRKCRNVRKKLVPIESI